MQMIPPLKALVHWLSDKWVSESNHYIHVLSDAHIPNGAQTLSIIVATPFGQTDTFECVCEGSCLGDSDKLGIKSK